MKNKKLFLPSVLLAIAIIAAAIFWTLSANSSGSETGGSDWKKITDDELSIGNPDADVVIIEYIDLQCPACAQFHRVLESSWRIIKDDVKVVFRHYPLLHIHPPAKRAAEYVEAARNQEEEKGYELLSAILSGQNTWSRSGESEAYKIFEKYAEDLGLDVQQMKDDATDSSIADKLQLYKDQGKAVPVRGTPTIIINGEVVSTPSDGKQLFALIKKAKDSAESN